MDVAERLISEQGFEGATVREISDEAKVNVAMISYYFGSKEKLFANIIEENSQATFSKLEYIANTSARPDKKIEALVSMYVDRIYTYRNFYRALLEELLNTHNVRPDLHKHINTMYGRNFNSMKQIIIEGQKKKYFRSDVDVEMTLASFFGTITEVINPQKMLQAVYENKISGKSTDVKMDEALIKRLKAHLTTLLKRHLIK